MTGKPFVLPSWMTPASFARLLPVDSPRLTLICLVRGAVVPGVFLIASVAAIQATVEKIRLVQGPDRVIASALMLLFISVIGLGSIPFSAQARNLSVAAAIYGLVVIPFVALPTVSVALCATVFVAAAVEEIVFRVALPIRLRSMWGTGKTTFSREIATCLLSQLTFALCHVVPRGALLTAFGAHELVRLTAVGVLFAFVTVTAGLWLSTAVHASMNLTLIAATEFSANRVGYVIPFACVVLCACLVASQHINPVRIRRF